MDKTDSQLQPLLSDNDTSTVLDKKHQSSMSIVDFVIGALNAFLFFWIFLALAYYWLETDGFAEIQMNAVHELSQSKILPLTFHHDAVFDNKTLADLSPEEQAFRAVLI